MKQQSLFNTKIKSEFGGVLNPGKRKTARPISTTKAMHCVLNYIFGNQLESEMLISLHMRVETYVQKVYAAADKTYSEAHLTFPDRDWGEVLMV